MFETLTDRLSAIFQRLRSRGKLTEADVSEVLREVRVALLEADVNLKVVKDFIASIRDRAVGAEVLESLTPAQAVIKIVHDGLVDLMGGQNVSLRLAPSGPTPIMLVGLQGSGKTTLAAKLALQAKEQGRRPLLVACDVYRPAAITQLEVLGQQIGVPVFAEDVARDRRSLEAGVDVARDRSSLSRSTEGRTPDPVAIAEAALAEARRIGYGAVLLDTAGRFQIDEELMQELERLKAAIQPLEILLVVDAMTGQEAVNVAREFDRRLDLTGLVLTKLDGDSRGGAALSIRAVTQKPVKFISVGEKVTALEAFHPDRLVSRILGMGDVLTLIEKTQKLYDDEQAKQLARKFQKETLSLQDFLEQLRQIRRMGSIADLVKMIPGVGKLAANTNVDDKDVARIEAIICSMTPHERASPDILNGSRRKRIAAGSGTQVQDVNRLIKQFNDSRKLIKTLGRMRGLPKLLGR